MNRQRSTVPCPHCGAEIDESAEFCRHCGSSAEDGWGEPDGAFDDDPLDDFDYEAFVRDEFGRSPAATGTAPLWWWTATALLALFVGAVLLRLFAGGW